jgi:hypothetical protein
MLPTPSSTSFSASNPSGKYAGLPAKPKPSSGRTSERPGFFEPETRVPDRLLSPADQVTRQLAHLTFKDTH